MALLGWSPPGEEEFLSMDDLCRDFSFDRVQRSNAAFDPVRLEWFNAQYIRRLSIEAFLAAAEPYLERAGIAHRTSELKDRLADILSLVQERVRTLTEVAAMVNFFFTDQVEIDPAGLSLGDQSASEVAVALNTVNKALTALAAWSSDEIVSAVTQVAHEAGWKRGDLFMAIRVAVTGRRISPPLTQSMEILGKHRSLSRIRHAGQFLEVASAG